MTTRRYVIVGNGVAGITAARTIRERDAGARIVIVGDESEHFYARTALMWVYMRQLVWRDLEPYERHTWRELRLELRRARVTAIDLAARRVALAGGEALPYDELLLAVGGRANMFGWPGQELDGVCNMCTRADLERLEIVRERLRRAVVVGGGLIGIELVEMMLHDRVPVTYLLRERWYWDMVLDRREGEIVQQRLREHGCQLVTEDEIGTIEGDSAGRVERVVTKKGQELPCELLGIAVGVSANTDLARAAGLRCGRGITVDAALRTSDPHVFAAGDCAEIELGDGLPLSQKLWYTGARQGRVAARAMLGDDVVYDPGVPYNSAQFLLLDYLNVGWLNKAPFAPPPALLGRVVPDLRQGLGLEEFFHRADGAPDTIRIAHRPDNGQVLGFSMLGSRWSAPQLMRWIRERRTLSWVLAHLGEAVFNEELRGNRFREVSDA